MKIYCAPAVGRSYEPDFISCLLKLLATGELFYRPVCNDALVSRSRSRAATEFLKYPADVLLMIDTDIIFKAEDALLLCREAVARGQVMTGLYSKRSETDKLPASVLLRGTTLDSSSSEPVEIRWGATGFMAIPRVVLEALVEDFPLCHPKQEWAFRPFFMPFIGTDDDGDPNYLSEDYAFCERVRQKGFGIYAIPSIHLLHIGPHAYELATPPYRVSRLDEPGYRYRVEQRVSHAALAGG